MRLAFYAPMKSPDHPVASGDRSIARALIKALQGSGAEVDLVSTLRSRDGAGDAQVQADLMQAAQTERDRILANPAPWDAWITYHNYYKAPDLLGPAITQALRLPYLLVEATRARKRLTGPWQAFAQHAEAATDAAQVVFYFSNRDAEALRRDAPADQQHLHLRPFLAQTALPHAAKGGTTLLSVGMLRHGDKLASYRLMAATLALITDLSWQLHIVGDGPARAEVAALMAPFGNRVVFHGTLHGAALDAQYQNAGLFFWPGVNEALGMAYLEAQAAGLPIIAQDRPGMREVLAPAAYPDVDAGPEGLAHMLRHLLTNDTARASASSTARAHVAAHHLLAQAGQTLQQGLALAGVAT